jgi:seryl-tRNA synthetase
MSAAPCSDSPSPALDTRFIPGYRWMQSGQSSFSGPLLALYARLDALFLAWASDCGADERLYPVLLPAAELAKLDYFRSFPHLATFACALSPEPTNLASFASGPGVTDDGVALTKLAPVEAVLTPAACYHVYVEEQGRALTAPRFVTTRCTCFRREAYYAPLRRQWSFGMREIVCLGTSDEVKGFLDRYRARVARFFEAIDLPVAWTPATDPFFNAAANPRFLAQKIDPVKTEMVYGDLAIGSVNFHRNFFGETFGIARAGAPAFSGCVAFGLERWIYAILSRFGADPSRWPDLSDPR